MLQEEFEIFLKFFSVFLILFCQNKHISFFFLKNPVYFSKIYIFSLFFYKLVIKSHKKSPFLPPHATTKGGKNEKKGAKIPHGKQVLHGYPKKRSQFIEPRYSPVVFVYKRGTGNRKIPRPFCPLEGEHSAILYEFKHSPSPSEWNHGRNMPIPSISSLRWQNRWT